MLSSASKSQYLLASYLHSNLTFTSQQSAFQNFLKFIQWIKLTLYKSYLLSFELYVMSLTSTFLKLDQSQRTQHHNLNPYSKEIHFQICAKFWHFGFHTWAVFILMYKYFAYLLAITSSDLKHQFWFRRGCRFPQFLWFSSKIIISKVWNFLKWMELKW